MGLVCLKPSQHRMGRTFRDEELNDRTWYQEQYLRSLKDLCRRAISFSIYKGLPSTTVRLNSGLISPQIKADLLNAFRGFHVQFDAEIRQAVFLSKALLKPPNFRCSCAECVEEAAAHLHEAHHPPDGHDDHDDDHDDDDLPLEDDHPAENIGVVIAHPFYNLEQAEEQEHAAAVHVMFNEQGAFGHHHDVPYRENSFNAV